MCPLRMPESGVSYTKFKMRHLKLSATTQCMTCWCPKAQLSATLRRISVSKHRRRFGKGSLKNARGCGIEIECSAIAAKKRNVNSVI